MNLGTVKLGITGNVLKIRGNVDRICGRREGGGLAAIQTIKTIIGKMKQK